MISGDKNILVAGSDARARLELQRGQVDQLDAFVWPQAHSLWDIVTAARKVHYDIITAQDPFFRGHLALHLRQLFGGRVNIQVHVDLASCSWLRRLFAKLQLWRADSIRAVSENIKQQVLQIAPKAKISVLPVYTNISEFSSVSRGVHQGKKILWMGRFEEEKNPLEAINILKEVLKEIPNAQLTMIGDGSLRQKLSDAAANLPVLVPVGWQNPLLYLDTADVLLSTSKHESWGAVFVEALAAGVPVVAPDVGIAKEAGAIVVPRPELASAVIKVLRSGERGVLKLSLPSAAEWARAWQKTLI